MRVRPFDQRDDARDGDGLRRIEHDTERMVGGEAIRIHDQDRHHREGGSSRQNVRPDESVHVVSLSLRRRVSHEISSSEDLTRG